MSGRFKKNFGRVSHKKVLSLFSYDPKTGIVTRKIDRLKGRFKSGSRAGSLWKSTGYRVISFDGMSFAEQDLVWFMHYKKWPKATLDHKNRKRDDNRIKNLREATKSQNQGNKAISINNTSGYKGVCLKGNKTAWQSYIYKNGKRIHIGIHNTAKEAARAYNKAAIAQWGDFAVINQLDNLVSIPRYIATILWGRNGKIRQP